MKSSAISKSLQFLKACGGNLAPITALAAIPIIAAAGLAIDYGRGVRAATELQALADAAVLAAAGDQNVTGTDSQKAAKRKTIATNYLNASMPEASDMEIAGTPVVTVGNNSVDLAINARVRGSLINVLNAIEQSVLTKGGTSEGRNIDITVRSKSSFGPGSYTCMLALNPSAKNSLSFGGNATLKGTNCKVQSNSNNAVAVSLQGAASMSASEICAVGGASGSKYTPTPTNCPAKTDPYASLVMPIAAASCTAAFTNVTVKNTTKNLTLGSYCGGIAVQTGGTINLAPGLYIIKNGTLSAASNSTINAPSGVTIYLTGAASKIDIASGATVTIKAPTSATADSTTLPYKSIAIMQDRTTGVGNLNQISSKGGVNITGAFYTPAQALSITANGAMNANSLYFPIIVDTFTAWGTGDLYVKLDYESAGFDNPLALMTMGKVSLVR